MAMRVMVLGLRGFPGIQGGVETHAAHLYPLLKDLGCEIEVLVRSPYWRERTRGATPGIVFTPLWCPSANGAEAFVHSFLGVLYAGLKRPDLLHIHAVGPALFAPLAKLLGLRVVVTHHGPDYDREKWSPLAKRILRAGERMGVVYSDARIVISGVIRDLVRRKYGRDALCIPNGVDIPEPPAGAGSLAGFGLVPGRYVLNVSRLVPEKRHLDLIEGFRRARLAGWKLALVGDLSADDGYVRRVREAARPAPGRDPDVVLAGFQSGATLAALYAHAGLFALPSSHEGLPIALLEALSHGVPAIASDIPANLEVGLPGERYFRLGDADALAGALARALAPGYAATAGEREGERERLRAWVRERYDWRPIARTTLGVYKRVCQGGWAARARATWLPE